MVLAEPEPSLLENYFSSICEASYNGIYSSWRYQLNLLQTLRGGSVPIENDNNLYISSNLHITGYFDYKQNHAKRKNPLTSVVADLRRLYSTWLNFGQKTTEN